MNQNHILTTTFALVALAIFLSVPNNEQQNSERLNILVVGDTGTGLEPQYEVAKRMDTIGAQENSQFILSLGDNFYEEGVSGINDPGYNTKYAYVYQNTTYVKNLPFYATIGNHDYYGVGLYSEFEYRENQWKIEDFFWSHTYQLGDQNIAFIHIDTDFLAYGIDGDKEIMGDYFKKNGWKNDEQILGLIEDQLNKYANYDWLVVMGHHQIGYSCPSIKNTDKVYTLLQKYKVDAYLNGHSHTLAYTIHDEMGMIISGAAAKYDSNAECAKSNPIFNVGDIFGFFTINFINDTIEVEAHYTDKDFDGPWVVETLPTIHRREKN